MYYIYSKYLDKSKVVCQVLLCLWGHVPEGSELRQPMGLEF